MGWLLLARRSEDRKQKQSRIPQTSRSEQFHFLLQDIIEVEQAQILVPNRVQAAFLCQVQDACVRTDSPRTRAATNDVNRKF